MSSGYQKMLALPAETENSIQTELIEKNEIKPSKKKTHPFIDKLSRIMKIFLKLANIKGYDLIGRVRNQNGDFVNDSDIISLINHSLTHGKLLYGQNEFIKLLFEAKIEPELIINENIKSKLLDLYTDKNEDIIENPPVSANIEEMSVNDIDENPQINKAQKRKIDSADGKIINEEIENKQPKKKKKKINWESNNSDDENWDLND